MSPKNPLKKFQKGVLSIITELITSFIFGFLMTLFVRDQVIGSDVVVIFTLIGFVGSISLMFSFLLLLSFQRRLESMGTPIFWIPYRVWNDR